VLRFGAMLTKRLTLLSVFAGGCLSGALLIGFWRADARDVPSPRQRVAFDRANAALVPPQRVSADENEPLEVASPNPPEHDAEEPSPEQGSSVADVLSRLEAVYRRELAAVAPVEVPAVAEAALPVAAEAAPVAVASPVPAAVAAPMPVAVAPVPPPKAAAPEVAAPAARAPEAVVALAPPTQGDERTRVVYVGDVNQNVYVGDVHQGDVYQMQQLQQLALLQQYVQILALSGGVGVVAAPTHTPRRQPAAPRRPAPFSTKLTDPNNPWGFDFPPTVLAK